ncbi:MAG: aspartate aminotransferase family protein [Myxococcales bacterium]|nr:aspartate aminotransferase family protein [Myxococcales bacterium]
MTTVRLPENGRPPEEVLAQMDRMAADDPRWREGRTFSLVYHAGEAHNRFLHRAYEKFFSENGLNPTAFRSLKRFESEIVQISAALLGGDENTVGLLTAGGTESILLALKTYRDRFRHRLRLPGKPRVLVPASAHVAFEKAAEYFDLHLVRVPLAGDFRVDLGALRRRLLPGTALVVASAPCYPYGVIDDVAEIGELCKRRGIPLHVDACLGGFLLPFLHKLGEPIPPWDFRVPGVTSISADLHKYGYAAKGASVLLWRSMEYMRHQFFVSTDWCGGVFASAGILGTRPGGGYAAAWGALQVLGEKGYLELHGKALRAARRIMDGIRAIPGLEVLGAPPATIFAYRSTDPRVNIFAVGDRLAARGWHVDRQQRPSCLHAMITAAHEAVAESFLTDLRAAVEEVRARPELAKEGEAAMYGLIAHVPLRGMIRKNVLRMMEALYGHGGEQPDLAGEASAGEPVTRWAVRMLPFLEKLSKLFRKG